MARKKRKRGARGSGAVRRAEGRSRAVEQNLDWMLDLIDEGYKRTGLLRKERVRMLNLYAGAHSTGDPLDEQSIPLFHRAMRSVIRSVIARNPEFTMTPKHSAKFAAFGRLMSAHINHRFAESRFRDLGQVLLQDALTGFAVCKTGIAPTGAGIEFHGKWADKGQTYIDRISPDDYIADPAGRSQAEFRFEGHRFRKSKQELLDAGFSMETIEQIPEYARQVRDRVMEDELGRSRWESDPENELVEVIQTVWRDDRISKKPLMVWLPGDPLYPYGIRWEKGVRPIRVEEYDGPEGGDYTLCVLDPVPDRPFGTPAMGHIRLLSGMANDLADHMIDSDLRMKKVMLVPEEHGDDYEKAMQNADNGDVVRTPSPERSQEVTVGGASEQMKANLGIWMELFSREAGNLDMLSGLGSQGDDTTATEVNEISGRLGAMLDDVNERWESFVGDCGRKVAWWEMHDPLLQETIMMKVGPVDIPLELSQETRLDSDLIDFNFETRVSSMRSRPPQARFRNLMQFAGNVIPLAIQMEMQTGGKFKAMQFIKTAAEGILDPADIESFLEDEIFSQENSMMAMSSTSAASAGDRGEIRKPGIPGTDSMPGGLNTGANSPNFDTEALGGQTLGGMGFGG